MRRLPIKAELREEQYMRRLIVRNMLRATKIYSAVRHRDIDGFSLLLHATVGPYVGMWPVARNMRMGCPSTSSSLVTRSASVV